MIKQLSFTRHEHKTLPNFRQMIAKAESTEDVKSVLKRQRPRSSSHE